MSQGTVALLLTAAVVAVLAGLAGTLYVFGVQLLFYYGIAAALGGVATLAFLVRPR